MIHRVHVVLRVEKQIATLGRADKKADLAAQRAVQIIAELQHGELSPENKTSLTKHGELRMKGCLKFDLGSGYRLVTLKQGADHYVLYCGTHDDCDRFIENNRDLRFEESMPKVSTYCIHRQGEVAESRPEEVTADLPEENQWIEINDGLLRQIFIGLTNREPDPA